MFAFTDCLVGNTPSKKKTNLTISMKWKIVPHQKERENLPHPALKMEILTTHHIIKEGEKKLITSYKSNGQINGIVSRKFATLLLVSLES
jgi:hypothetical protein